MSVTQEFTVTGMTCGHCVMSVKEEVSALPGVTDVDVTLESGLVKVTSDAELERALVAAAVADAGYTVQD